MASAWYRCAPRDEFAYRQLPPLLWAGWEGWDGEQASMVLGQ